MKTFEEKVRELRKQYPNNQEFGRNVNLLLIEVEKDRKDSDKQRNK